MLRGEPPQPEDLLTPKNYDDRIHAQYGSVCGQVFGPDGKPLFDGVLELWSVEDETFLPKTQYAYSDSEGRFCIQDVVDGKFWLGGEKYEHASKSRLVGYYPAGIDRSQAVPVEVNAKAHVEGLQFALQKQDLYIVTFRIVPAKHKFHSKPASIVVTSKNGDALYGHQESIGVDDDGVARPLMTFPPGRYTVSIFFGMRAPGAAAVGLFANQAKLPLPEQEVDITSGGELVIRVMPPD